ncbi:hypothetical protein ACFSO7_00125 [Bacillus sp. CGMCC 1.16607]|uniref:hypothetical protein n=1 Tax=Bacillus sp. CGMCC 1.16607 TaxID=3351842 RepID=UPI00363E0526
MNTQIQMVIQYEVNESSYSQYKIAIRQVLSELPTFEADQIQVNTSKNKVVETFILPTESHYYALKKLRTSKNHSIFGCLDPHIKGGLQQIGFYGIKKTR